MKKNIVLIVLAMVIILIGIISLVIYFNNKQQNNVANNSENSNEEGVVAGSTAESYFDDNAPVMYFYSEYCSWCKKEAEVLKELAKDGYKVKPMNVKDHPEYWQDYSINGTPAFIAKDGNKLAGYQNLDKLKDFFDKYK